MSEQFPSRRVEDLAGPWRGAIKIGPFGSQLRKEDMTPVGIRVYGQENVISDDWSIGDRRITLTKYNTLKSCELAPGDIVVSMMGTVGKCSVFPSTAEVGVMDSHLLRIQPDADQVTRDFLAFVLQAPNVVGRQVAALSHGSIMAGLSSKIVKSFEIPVPPIEEQPTILSVFDALDTAIHETEAIIAKLKAVKQGLLHDLLTRGIDANGELRPLQKAAPHLYKQSSLGWIPVEWNVVAIEELADTYAGGTPSREVPAFFGGTIPWVKSTEVNKESILATDESLSELGLRNSSAKWVPAETPLMAMYGATAGVVSWLCINATTNQAVLALMPKRDFIGRWIYWALKFSAPRLLLSIQGSGQPNLSKGAIDAHTVAAPPPHEQMRVADVLDSQVYRVNSEKLTLNKLLEKKRGLMDDLLTGRIRVTPLLKADQQAQARSS